MKTFTIDPAGDGDFAAIGAALATLDPGSGGARILLRPGIYREKTRVMVPGISVIGEDPLSTVITWDDHAKREMSPGVPMGTFNSYTLYAGAADFHLENVTVENSAGHGRLAGQAIAFFADADRISLRNCVISGFQDTLFTGPLPTDPVPKGLSPAHPMRGSGKDTPSRPFRQYYEGCAISGTVDFIFGPATAVFKGCRVISRKKDEALYGPAFRPESGSGNDLCPPERYGYITAASTYQDEEHGFVFLDCSLEGDADVGSVFLARPWRNHAKTAFVNCRMGPHIHPFGWDNWSKPEVEALVRFAEYGSSGPGADSGSRVSWAIRLDPAAVESLSPERILGGRDRWRPF